MIDDLLAKIDQIRERTGLGYKAAQELLDKNGGDVVTALIDYEENQLSWKDEISGRGVEVFEKVKHLLHEGNITKVIIKSDGKTLLEVPITFGAIGALLAPQLAAIGGVLALLNKCTIEIVRKDLSKE